ncbi:MAG: hypothetical protein COT90_02300 [Candidatus Diapherotrites archaeon CG10_big_fil_rev_8_21_14_0_10_31_34]|nr:MAG: hypothetical protein COT90_02300 [Candidatus Diapherotrites archaeon CG10_big_fil_rev_8_21_14_0_10_31_34]
MKTPIRFRKASNLLKKAPNLLRKLPGLNRRKNKKPFKARQKQEKTGGFDRRKDYFLVEEKIGIIPQEEKKSHEREQKTSKREIMGSPKYTDLNKKGKRRTVGKILSIKNPEQPYKRVTIDKKTFLARNILIKTDRRNEEGFKVISNRRKTAKKKE